MPTLEFRFKMDTSTPLSKKVKAACYTDFEYRSATANRSEDFAINDSPIVKVYDSVLEESDVVLSQKLSDVDHSISKSGTTS